MKDVNMILGERIRLGRKANQLTREKLAELIDVSPRFLAEVEAGKVGVSLQTLIKISRSLSVSSDFLLGLESDVQLSQFEVLCAQLKCVDEKYFPLLTALVKEMKNIG